MQTPACPFCETWFLYHTLLILLAAIFRMLFFGTHFLRKYLGQSMSISSFVSHFPSCSYAAYICSTYNYVFYGV